MRTSPFGTILGLLGLGLPLLGVGQFQVIATEDDGSATWESVFTTGGDIITMHGSDGAAVFRKYAADGTVIWNRALMNNTAAAQGPFATTSSMCRDADGGAFFVFQVNAPHDGDTAWYRMVVGHIHADGAVDMRILERYRTFLGSPPSLLYADCVRIASPDGMNMVIATTFGALAFSSLTDLVQLNETLDLVWARSIGDQTTPWLVNPTAPVIESNAIGSDRSLAFTVDGSLLYVRRHGSDSDNPMDVIRFNASGDIQWARRFTYTNMSMTSTIYDIVIDANDRIHGAWNLGLPTGSFLLVPVIGPDGSLHHAGMYRTTQFYNASQIDMTSDGRRIIHCGGSTMICDTMGSPGVIKFRRALSIGDQNVSLQLMGSDVYNDMYCGSGYIYEQHQITSFTNHYRGVLSTSVDELNTCFHADTTAEYYEVPLEIIEQEDLSDEQSIDVLVAYSALPPDGIVITEPDPPTFEELCANYTGMADSPSFTDRPIVANNLVAPGTPLWLARPIIGQLHVLDVRGQILREIRLNGSTTDVPTSGWASGLYLLRAFGADGRTLGTQRVVIE